MALLTLVSGIPLGLAMGLLMMVSAASASVWWAFSIVGLVMSVCVLPAWFQFWS